jgi:hypothetical protein
MAYLGALDGFQVRIATDADFPYLMSLQRANRESVGGLPGPALRERIVRRAALLGLLNGEPCGYLLCDHGRDMVLRIPQACIQYDARRRAYGAALVGWALRGFSGEEVRVRCAADLEANLFWRELGFVCTATVPGGKRRGRTLNLWQLWLTPRLITADAIATPPVAQHREDTMYDETDYLHSAPDGFVDGGSLGKLAWANRKG